MSFYTINSLPNDKTLEWSKLKAFTYDILKAAEIMIFVFDSVENIVGTGENAGYQHFLLFPLMFSKGFFFRIVWKSLKFVVW